jgi:DNA-binding IclR family transcriptional regulator
MEKKGKRSIQSLKKASEILNVFIDDNKAYGITDFARALSLPKPTVQSLVQTLEEIGYLEKDPMTSKYTLGPLLFQLGMKYATNMDLAAVARVWMEKLCAQYREAAHVGILVGGKVVVVMRVEPDNKFMTFPQAGSVIPFHSSAIGKVLFAHMDPARRDEILAECGFEKLTECTVGSREEFLSHLEKVKRDGVAFDDQESVTGLACIGAPIFNNRGQAVAAFSITGNAYNVQKNREEMIHAVKYVSHQISSHMGYRKGA